MRPYGTYALARPVASFLLLGAQAVEGGHDLVNIGFVALRRMWCREEGREPV